VHLCVSYDSYERVIVSLNCINEMLFIMDTQYVSCEVGIDFFKYYVEEMLQRVKEFLTCKEIE
jgi:hypothetical protein